MSIAFWVILFCQVTGSDNFTAGKLYDTVFVSHSGTSELIIEPAMQALVSCDSAVTVESTAVKINGLGLDNLYKVDEGVYRSEQPESEEFKLLENYGIGEILNLRHWHSDKRHVGNTRLILHRVRMSAHNISDYDVVKALRIIKNRRHPVLIHCHHGSDRTGTIVAMYRIVFQNRSKESAIEELKDARFGFHTIYTNIPNYIKNVDVEKIKKQLE
ncbi:MAG: dual specificity protein phosphatase family protein [Prevotellaceae bacterium]|nr:dual specificity protein phosphatase family protein [Prevotellaceae bacterium]